MIRDPSLARSVAPDTTRPGPVPRAPDLSGRGLDNRQEKIPLASSTSGSSPHCCWIGRVRAIGIPRPEERDIAVAIESMELRRSRQAGGWYPQDSVRPAHGRTAVMRQGADSL
jgi:hypothetical protein